MPHTSFINDKIRALEVMIPKPSPYDLLRLGGPNDGAYLVPDDMIGIEACFSPGVYRYKTFEDELAQTFNIKSHLCDFSTDEANLSTPLISSMQTFEKKWLDIQDGPESISLQNWINTKVPDSPHSDLILQMDIEGSEYHIIDKLPRDLMLRFRIIIIELHGLFGLQKTNPLGSRILPTLLKLGTDHTCIHAHANNCCGDYFDYDLQSNIPRVLELTLIRNDRLYTNLRKLPPRIPHPLDIPFNNPKKSPILLVGEWKRYC